MPLACKPNLFIVGAPKAGTTSLYSYLSQHPSIFMSRIKELQYFSGDICGHQRRITTLSDYLDCFHGGEEKAIVGEASTTYLASRIAPRAIREFSGSARIIIMLRNPLDIMYAEHSERLFGGTEHIRDFETAVDSRQPRTWRLGPFTGKPVMRLHYSDLARFSDATTQYINVFGRENVHVIFFEDLMERTELVCAEVLSFLNLPFVSCDLSVANPNRKLRNKTVQRWLRYPPRVLKLVIHPILSLERRKALGERLLAMNTRLEPRPELPAAVQRRIIGECTPDLQRLGAILNRDLSYWTKVDG